MVRILVVGPIASFADHVPKIKKLCNKSGPFDYCLILNSPSTIPQQDLQVPTYFVAEAFRDDSNPRSIGSSIYYNGTVFCGDLRGLCVVMCADDEGAEALCKQLETEEKDIAHVDVMITHRGPQNSDAANDAITRLGRAAKPRYHFYGAASFRAFDPFQVAGANYVTRVIAVGESGRWVYAADVTPLRDMSESDCLNTIPQQRGDDLYAFNNVKRRREQQRENKAGSKRPRKDCWFCLSNEVESHLVVAVGETAYIALAKGGINDSHFVIVPVNHVTGSTSQQASDEMICEVERYIKAIRQYYRERKNSEALVFEWCGEADMMHMCVQMIAIRKEVCGRVAKMFVETAERFGMEVKIESGLDGIREARSREGKECFWAELPDDKRLIVGFSDDKKLIANFGRLVAAQALGQIHRLDWRKCVLPRASEEQLAARVDDELRKLL